MKMKLQYNRLSRLVEAKKFLVKAHKVKIQIRLTFIYGENIFMVKLQ
jgi:hypothetical protein